MINPHHVHYGIASEMGQGHNVRESLFSSIIPLNCAPRAFSEKRGEPISLIKRFAFWFGVAGYVLTFLYYKGPHPFSYSRNLGQALPYLGCYFALGGMPVGAVLMDFAPVNATIYAIVGAGVGWSFSKLGLRHNLPRPTNR